MADLTILDKASGHRADFNAHHNVARNVAVLRAGLQSLYDEVKGLEKHLPEHVHSIMNFDVSGEFALMAAKFDWFSISMVNLMQGVSLLDTLSRHAPGMGYEEFSSMEGKMRVIADEAKQYVPTIPEAHALLLWRHKVAAHRSGIFPPPRKQQDDEATRLISLFGIQVMIQNGKYIAPGMKPGETEQLPEWSLTEIWETLEASRYEWLNDGSFFEGISGVRLI